jgi:hypothetical protein
MSYWLEEGILYCRYCADLDLKLEVAKSVVAARLAFSKGRYYPLLVDMRGIRSSTGAARKYLASEGVALVTAGALVIDSEIGKAMGNLFLKIDMPPVPTRLFTNEEKARMWLTQYLIRVKSV